MSGPSKPHTLPLRNDGQRENGGVFNPDNYGNQAGRGRASNHSGPLGRGVAAGGANQGGQRGDHGRINPGRGESQVGPGLGSDRHGQQGRSGVARVQTVTTPSVQSGQRDPTPSKVQESTQPSRSRDPASKVSEIHKAKGGQGKVYIFPHQRLPEPDVEVTRLEDRNAALNKKMTINDIEKCGTLLPPRTEYGAAKTVNGISEVEMTVAANFLRLDLKTNVRLHKYTVSFALNAAVGEEVKKHQRRWLLGSLLQKLRNDDQPVATDFNEIIITKNAIEMGGKHSITMPLEYPGAKDGPPAARSKSYITTIGSLKVLNMDDLEAYMRSPVSQQAAAYPDLYDAVTALEIVIKHTPNTGADIFPTGGHIFFHCPADKSRSEYLDLGGGLNAVRGYHVSVRTTTSGALVNVHDQTSVFYPPVNVLKLMESHGLDNRVKLQFFLRNLFVRTDYMRDKGKTIVKTQKVIGLSKNGADSEGFYNGEDKWVTIREYFEGAYGIILQHPNEPLLQVGTIRQNSKGSTLNIEQKIWLPAELAEIEPGQEFRGTLSSEQSKVRLTYAVRPPAENARRLMDHGLRVLGLDLVKESTLSAFGLGYTPELVTVPARVLSPPEVHYGNMVVKKIEAVWNTKGMKFAIPSPLCTSKNPLRWAILPIRTDDAKYLIGDKNVSSFRHTLLKQGLTLGAPQRQQTLLLDDINSMQSKNDDRIKEAFDKMKKGLITIILIILPSDDGYLYGRIKQISECKVGIITTCIKKDKWIEGSPSTYANIGLKFNSKLGGINHRISQENLGFLQDDTMIVGIDVSHPDKTRSIRNMPSVVAVVASVDVDYMQYPSSIRLQNQVKTFSAKKPTKTREIVRELTEMIIERLEEYRGKRHVLPRKILVYRDGVSDSQYKEVIDDEYASIKTACRLMYPLDSQPLITIIIATKRHRTRLYPVDEAGSDLAKRGKGNVKPGTLVERHITMPHGTEFYLVSHKTLEGTTKPCRYILIKDEIRAGVDNYQRITYNLCYLFARAPVAVSYCPPAFYADLAAERGKAYLYGLYNESNEEKRMQEFDRETSDWPEGAQVPHPHLKGVPIL